MPQILAVKASSFSDGATLRRASNGSYKGSTAGSFVGSAGGGSFAPSSAGGSFATGTMPPQEESLLESDGPQLAKEGVARWSYLLQYFAVGFIYGGLPATTYGFLKGYLGVPAFVYTTCNTVMTMPWSFKFAFGAFNDCVPIRGYRRKPYMVFGWTVCTLMLIGLYMVPLPPPYYCIDEATGALLTNEPPCHPESADQGGLFTLLMTGACLGYVVADVAADGLTVQYARAEPESSRGYTQTTAYLTRAIGQIAAYSLVGFGMNGKQYLGSFMPKDSLSFSDVALCFACMAAVMVPVSLLGVHEQRLLEQTSFSEYASATWALMRSKAFFYVVLWQFLNPAIQYVATTAAPNVTQFWADVGGLQKQVMNILGYVAFSWALYVVRERFLHVSWRLMLITTTVSLVVLDVPFTMLTVFDVVRNQYFYLSETLAQELPDAIFFVVSCFVIVELASANNEGLVYGLLSTVSNVGKSLPNAVSNQIFAHFHPALSDEANYIAAKGGDQPCFRVVVALSFVVGYAFALSSLIVMPLMPGDYPSPSDSPPAVRRGPPVSSHLSPPPLALAQTRRPTATTASRRGRTAPRTPSPPSCSSCSASPTPSASTCSRSRRSRACRSPAARAATATGPTASTRRKWRSSAERVGGREERRVSCLIRVLVVLLSVVAHRVPGVKVRGTRAREKIIIYKDFIMP